MRVLAYLRKTLPRIQVLFGLCTVGTVAGPYPLLLKFLPLDRNEFPAMLNGLGTFAEFTGVATVVFGVSCLAIRVQSNQQLWCVFWIVMSVICLMFKTSSGRA